MLYVEICQPLLNAKNVQYIEESKKANCKQSANDKIRHVYSSLRLFAHDCLQQCYLLTMYIKAISKIIGIDKKAKSSTINIFVCCLPFV